MTCSGLPGGLSANFPTGGALQGLPIQQPHCVADARHDPGAGLDDVNDGEDAQRSHHAACAKAANRFGPNVSELPTDCVMLAHFRQRCVSPLPKSKNVAIGLAYAVAIAVDASLRCSEQRVAMSGHPEQFNYRWTLWRVAVPIRGPSVSGRIGTASPTNAVGRRESPPCAGKH